MRFFFLLGAYREVQQLVVIMKPIGYKKVEVEGLWDVVFNKISIVQF